MIGLPQTRRGAERFADLVDSPVGHHDDDLTAELLALVGALREVPAVDPRPEFSTSLRERLLAAAAVELAGPAPERGLDEPRVAPPARRRRERRLAVAVGAFAVVASTTSVAVASQGALPGDALYPVKRIIENTHAHLALSDQGRGTTLLHSAGDRLDEVQGMTRGQDADADEVSATLQTFSTQLTQGADLLMQDYRDHGNRSSIDVLRRFDSAGMLTLSALEGTVPAASEPDLLDAAETLFTIDAQAGQLCADCSTAGITEIPPTLLASDTDATAPDSATTGPAAPAAVTTAVPGSGRGHGSGHHRRPHLSASSVPTAEPTSRPTPTSSGRPTASASPTTRASTAGSALPTTVPTAKATATSLLSSLLGGTHHHTRSPRPTPHGSAVVPSVVPTVGPVVSSIATAVATTLDQLLGGLGK